MTTALDALLKRTAVELLPGRLFFVCLPPAHIPPPAVLSVTFLGPETDLVYEQFFADFGPVCLAKVVRFCRRVHEAVTSLESSGPVYCYCPDHPHRKANAAFLLGAYTMLRHQKSAVEAYAPFLSMDPPLSGFRDASFDICTYRLSVLDCLCAIERAVAVGHFDFDKFDLVSYEFLDQIEHGDMNWIVPRKFLAFSGPLSKRREVRPGVFTLLPEECAQEFKRLGVAAVVRFNEKCYDRKRFTELGIRHHELFYEDGSNPPEHIMLKFLEICENEPGAVAVHCKAGLGRTGTNIAVYMMKHYRYTSREAIAWCRICRPGCVVGQQQAFVSALEPRFLWQRERVHSAGGSGTGGRRMSKRSVDLTMTSTVSKWAGATATSHDFNSTLTLPADEEEPADSRYGATVPQATRRGMTRTGTGSRGSTKVVMKAAVKGPGGSHMLTDQRDMISDGYDVQEGEGRMSRSGVLTTSVRLDDELIGIHATALQHRNRRQAAIEQQQEFQGLAASTKRQGRPSSSSGMVASASTARRGSKTQHQRRLSSSGSNAREVALGLTSSEALARRGSTAKTYETGTDASKTLRGSSGSGRSRKTPA